MIRQAAFAGNNKLLKGALHCHTTRSDGVGTPEEVLRYHGQHGYDFVALTDHRIYNFKNFDPDTGIIIIPGMEIDGNIPADGGVHCFHCVTLGREKDKGNPYEQDQCFERKIVADQDEFQPILDELHSNGQMTMYCHPEWSNTPSYEFDRLHGNFAMEIWNTGCVLDDGLDTNAAYWDDLLMQGQHIYGCATDDGHAMNQHCGGWVNVNAEKNVDSVLEALSNGAFYSSTAPEIYDFYEDDGIIHIKCSPCCEVVFRSGYHPLPRTYNADGGITEAQVKYCEGMKYIRATITDKQGRRAWTNPIFFEEK